MAIRSLLWLVESLLIIIKCEKTLQTYWRQLQERVKDWTSGTIVADELREVTMQIVAKDASNQRSANELETAIGGKIKETLEVGCADSVPLLHIHITALEMIAELGGLSSVLENIPVNHKLTDNLLTKTLVENPSLTIFLNFYTKLRDHLQNLNKFSRPIGYAYEIASVYAEVLVPHADTSKNNQMVDFLMSFLPNLMNLSIPLLKETNKTDNCPLQDKTDEKIDISNKNGGSSSRRLSAGKLLKRLKSSFSRF
eukprot:GHVL01005625.1.p1 GENE.GHVL01005625.1~~GHVL01005625.1.p1  ORF type:complete len:254 (-),score=48.07 GHVL01005625.1:1135-1896(-)